MRLFDAIVGGGLAVSVLAGLVFFDFFDSHQWVVTGTAMLVTAAATAYLARFSYATVRLFRLQEEQVEATKARLHSDAAQILATLMESQEELRFAHGEDPISTASRYPIALGVGNRLEMLTDRLANLEKDAERVGREWVRYFRRGQRLAIEAYEEFETRRNVAENRRESDPDVDAWPQGFVEDLQEAIEPVVTHLASNESIAEEADPLVAPLFEVED